MAIIKGGTSGVSIDSGATSKGMYVEVLDGGGKLYGAAKTIFTLRAVNFTSATTEAMVTLTPSRDLVEGAAGTTFTVTAGKRLVLIGVSVSCRNAGAAGQGVVVKVRSNPGGAAIVTSPIIAVSSAGTNLAIANVSGSGFALISPGYPCLIELSDPMQIGISQQGTATAGNDVCLWGYEY